MNKVRILILVLSITMAISALGCIDRDPPGPAEQIGRGIDQISEGLKMMAPTPQPTRTSANRNFGDRSDRSDYDRGSDYYRDDDYNHGREDRAREDRESDYYRGGYQRY